MTVSGNEKNFRIGRITRLTMLRINAIAAYAIQPFPLTRIPGKKYAAANNAIAMLAHRISSFIGGDYTRDKDKERARERD